MRTISISAALLWSVFLATAASGQESNPRRQAYERSTGDLEGLVAQAHSGRITPEQLRNRRRRVESRLAGELAQSPLDLKPGDLREVSVARGEMNQAIIHSHEFEFFGPVDRPEWGWYPSRKGISTGSTLEVDDQGRASYNVLR
jgi:hypothetical protein